MDTPVPLTEGEVKNIFEDTAKLNRMLDKTKSEVFIGKSAAFFAPLMCSLDFKWVNSDSLPTAATDGESLWWNIHDFLRCCNKERVSTLMHELWHVARLHNLRIGNRCPDLWNQACDIKINRELKNDGYFIGSSWLLRPDITLDLEEDIYDLLNKNTMSMPQPISNGSSGSGNPDNQHSNGHCVHSQLPVTPETKKKLINATVKATQQAHMSKNAGAIPGGTEYILDKFLKPKVPWESHLSQWMTELMDEDYTWRRPNRRHQDIYLPSRFTDDGRLQHLAYYWDVSGSIGPDEEIRFNSEVKYIWETFKPEKMTLLQFDTQITNVQEYKAGDTFSKVKIIGKGGTNLAPVRAHIMSAKPTAAIIFSDLYCTPMGDIENTCPVIWAVVSNPNATVPFGKLIHVEL